MSHDAEPPSHGIGLSYASSFWLWASAKAAKNRHWLLSLITLTTFMMQALTISMSALFQQNSFSMPQARILERNLEIRRDPLIATTFLEYGEGIEDRMFYKGNPAGEVSMMLAETLIDLESNWLYTALLQASLQGPEPPWSSDGWNFAPLDLSEVTQDLSVIRMANNQGNETAKFLNTANLTARTSAVRGRVECSVIEDLQPDMWLTTEGGTKNSTSSDRVYYPQIAFSFENATSQITPMAATPECCYNQTDPSISTQSLDMVTTLAYWTEKRDSINVTTRDFTAKWIRGTAGFRDVGGFAQNPRMVFREPPAIQALNCVPYFETADAEVTVEPSTGAVQGFSILGNPTPDAVAWSDNFQLRRSNESNYRFHNSTETRRFYHNITTSYGTLFMKSLLRAACLENINYSDESYLAVQRSDYLFDKIFNMRDNSTGLNVDFMSYAALAQVGHDPTALLNPDVLIRETQRIFSIFFQHYVSGNVSLQNGGWAYQQIDSNLSLTEPIPNEALQQAPSKFEDFPLRKTERRITATLYTQTEVLQMNATAFWVSLSIMIWLIVAITVFAAMQRRYLGGMQRNVECIADVLVLVAGSERLLDVIREQGIDSIVTDDRILTRLGWFRDLDGTMRWRIDLVDEREGQARPISLSTAYAPVPRDDEESGSIVPSATGSRR
ncbi:hypothetical protein E8E12_004832 [Didymella heteroderae]|uniref:Uncharacterized protein n=1 Tax=Didymella heteroderae TaxID=1769908 RepID=A0A9P5BZI4_9PLEO|nr:hypothetical protein E8E12_004832 [Didymella heteroderae]